MERIQLELRKSIKDKPQWTTPLTRLAIWAISRFEKTSKTETGRLSFSEMKERGKEFGEQLRKAQARWDALPPEEQARQIAERKYKEEVQEYLTRVGALNWWAEMIEQGYNVERPPNPGPDPRIKKGEVLK